MYSPLHKHSRDVELDTYSLTHSYNTLTLIHTLTQYSTSMTHELCSIIRDFHPSLQFSDSSFSSIFFFPAKKSITFSAAVSHLYKPQVVCIDQILVYFGPFYLHYNRGMMANLSPGFSQQQKSFSSNTKINSIDLLQYVFKDHIQKLHNR